MSQKTSTCESPDRQAAASIDEDTDLLRMGDEHLRYDENAALARVLTDWKTYL